MAQKLNFCLMFYTAFNIGKKAEAHLDGASRVSHSDKCKFNRWMPWQQRIDSITDEMRRCVVN